MMKCKKTALAVLALSFAGLASAGMYGPPPMEPTETDGTHGFYLGIGAGGIGLTDKITETGSAVFHSTTSLSGTTSADGGSIGLNSYLLAGYAWKLPNKVFLGTEIFGNLTNAGSSVDVTSTDLVLDSNNSVDVTLQYVYGIRALPGFQITPDAVVYGIIGYARAHATSDLSASLAAGADTYSQSVSDSYNFNGYQLGLGSMISASTHVAIRGDLIYTGYESQTLRSGSVSSSTFSGEGSISAQPSTLEADVGLVFTFD